MAARLLIRKGMVNIQGRNRPCVQVLAQLAPAMHTLLLENFGNENLFKRTTYQNGFPDGIPKPSPYLMPYLQAFLKNDACPEITVKSLLAGQLQQCQNIWEMMVFEYVAKRAFDALLDMIACAVELQTETIYAAPGADALAFAADTAAELLAAPVSIAPGRPDGLANAA